MTNDNYQRWNHQVSQHPTLESFSFIEYPGLVAAYNVILDETKSMTKGDYIPAKFVHYLYDTHGLDKPVVEKLMKKLGK